MKEGQLWDLIDTLCSKEEKKKLIAISEISYSILEDAYNELISDIKNELD